MLRHHYDFLAGLSVLQRAQRMAPCGPWEEEVDEQVEQRGQRLSVLDAGGSTPPANGQRRCQGMEAVSSAFITDIIRRCGLYATVVAGAMLIGMSWHWLGPWLRGAPTPPAWDVGIALTLLLTAGLIAWRGRHPGSCPRFTIRLATILQLALCAFSAHIYMGMLDCSSTAPRIAVGLPWTGLLIVLFPLMVPGGRLYHGVLAVAGASMVPLMWVLHNECGWTAFGPNGLLDVSVPAFICVMIALLASTITTRFSADVDKARAKLLELGSYTLDSLLGQGGMGEVWLAHHRMLKRPAAIKLIDPERLARSGQDPRLMLERFEREATATARLRSSHTVELYDFGRTEAGSFYYAMELLDGIDLEALVLRHGPMDAARTVHVLRQTCCSLAEAHDIGLIHRDIKPANIFLCRQGRELDVVKVLDFGLVMHSGLDGSDRLTRDDQISGTPAYMAPEVALGERDIDHRVDIYAVGCVALWLLTGTAPFERDTSVKTLMAQVNDPPPQLGARAPAALEELIQECLAKDPARRPADMLSVLRRLQAIVCEPAWGAADMIDWWDRNLPATGSTSDRMRKQTTTRALSRSA
ncbi:MAG: serine/threonine-protein kinase [Planctomycetota bacterium]